MGYANPMDTVADRRYNNEEKYYDASQLYGNVKIPVINNSNQTPEINSIKNTGDEGGQFIFIKK